MCRVHVYTCVYNITHSSEFSSTAGGKVDILYKETGYSQVSPVFIPLQVFYTLLYLALLYLVLYLVVLYKHK